tara:strand:+ start:309 stop:611 length:303 start_codon:yes stop_codon:yes gene_type:complete
MDTKKIKNISMIIGALSLFLIAISFTINSISNKAVNDIVIEEYKKEQERIAQHRSSNNTTLSIRESVVSSSTIENKSEASKALVVDKSLIQQAPRKYKDT